MSGREPVSDEELRRLSEFLYRRTGMAFGEGKRTFIERRVVDRMEATGADRFGGYFRLLQADHNGEIERFINAFTVNETYFYREDHQLRCLADDLLPRRAAAGSSPLRIWSVPCSTGEEPYSVALWLLENWRGVDDHDVEIIGSDIDTAAIEAARAGVFGKRALMRLQPGLVARYFRARNADSWEIIPDIRDSVGFTTANLIDRASIRRHGRFDVIFCRNVLIYFDEAARRTAAENLFESLLPGGFLCLGHAESMSRISSLFEVCRFADAIVYRRPMEDARA